MEYVNLGKAGVKVSRICLGCMSFGKEDDWKIDIDQAKKVVKRALDLGINFFDTANGYSSGRSEEITGECLKGTREDVVLATKVYFPTGQGPNDLGLSRRHITQQIQKSLKRLKTDHVDLYQIHRWDYGAPIDETLRTLNDLVRQGFTCYIGASSMFAWQFLKALYVSERLGLEKFVSMQNHYSLLYREEEREMNPLCKEMGIALIPWSPLARGFLAGKYKRGIEPNTIRYKTDKNLSGQFFKPEDFNIAECVETIAQEKSVAPAQVSLAWLLHKGVTAPIIGATRPEHVEEAVGAVDVKLDADDVKRLDAGYRPRSIIGLD